MLSSENPKGTVKILIGRNVATYSIKVRLHHSHIGYDGEKYVILIQVSSMGAMRKTEPVLVLLHLFLSSAPDYRLTPLCQT